MITCVLLAAGRGERFGGKKLLATLPDGRTVIGATVDNILPTGLPIVLVIRADADLQAKVDALRSAHPALTVVTNTAADSGMASSIACGIAASKIAAGWLIALADMPYVKTTTYSAVSEAVVSASSIAQPTMNAKRGQPVGFGRDYGKALLTITGDVGARGVIAAHPDRVSLVGVDDPGIFQDIDTPDDLRR